MIFRTLKILFMLLTLVGASATVRAEVPPVMAEFRPVFSRAISDLPIMPGLIEEADSIVIFDKPHGRVVETSATGVVPAHKIQTFYGRALPALGWVSVGKDRYQRDNEILDFNVKAENTDSSVSFTITPNGEDK